MLSGIRIIQIEGLGPGPFAAMTLADLGADVIVVHRKDAPTDSPGVSEKSLLDRGKRSIALDLKDRDDVETLLDLLATADGLIEGFRPGVMERLGLGPDQCMKVNPQLVFGRMTGWGQDGPLAHSAGHDLNYISVSGALWYASPPGETPISPATLVGDVGGGALYLVIGMLAGIMKARATGEGRVVDAAIVDGSAHMMNLLMALKQTGNLSFERGKSMLDGPHWSSTYRTSDSGFMSVQCIEPRFYSIFLEKLGLGDDPDFARQFDKTLWGQLGARLEGIFGARTRGEWAEIFEGSDACTSAVLHPADAARHPHMMARKAWLTFDGVDQAAPAPRFSPCSEWSPSRVPIRGEHSKEIMSELADAKAGSRA